MKKRVVPTLIFILSALLSNAQTIGIQQDNPGNVKPCSSQTFELTNVSAYIQANLPAGWKVCSVLWEDAGYHPIQTTTDPKVTLTISKNFTLMAYVTLGDANCSQQTHVSSSTLDVKLIDAALTTPGAGSPASGCTQPFPASVSFINDANHFVPDAGSYSVTWNTPSGWSYSPAALSTNITPDANSTGNISATVTLNACPYQVTSPALAITRSAPTLALSSSNPLTGCGTSRMYSVDAPCGASSYTYTISGNAALSFASGSVTQTLTTASISIPIYYPSGSGNFWLSAVANYPNGASSSSVSNMYWYGLPTLSIVTNKIVGDVISLSTNVVYKGATFTWKVDNVVQGGGVDQTTFIDEPQCGIRHTISVVATGACGTTNTPTTFFTPSCTGGGGPLAIDPHVSPNPVQGVMKIYLPTQDAVTGETKKSPIRAIRIVDKIGRIVRKYEYGTGVTECNINTEGLSKDIYIIQVFDGRQWSHREIIVQ